MKRYIVFCLAVLLTLSTESFAQKDKLRFSVKSRSVYLELDPELDAARRDSILVTLGFPIAIVPNLKVGDVSEDQWTIVSMAPDQVVLRRALTVLGGAHWGVSDVVLDGASPTTSSTRQSYAEFGYNPEPIDHIRNEGEKTTFKLPGYLEAHEVYLAGNFNNWSTLSDPMKFENGAWSIQINLEPGVWAYKFIVDGRWIVDPNNKERFDDGFGNINSRFVKTNHVFKLQGFEGEKKVYLAGDFNEWRERSIRLWRAKDGWVLPVYLADGTYRYKYILNGDQWITDPGNPVQRPDESGNMNSVLAIGKATTFRLKGFSNAQHVILTGSFIGWDERELQMKKDAEGWYLSYVLAPGNYAYKFIVDGDWKLDPNNACVVEGENQISNSLVCIAPNVTFRLDGYDHAKSVYLSGSFNGWAKPGYALERKNNGWELSIHLYPGKYNYKFVVDGEWIHDPGNPQKEHNEYGGYNSVLWVD
jgi:1,4-alpha-glucan branching enzyme